MPIGAQGVDLAKAGFDLLFLLLGILFLSRWKVITPKPLITPFTELCVV